MAEEDSISSSLLDAPRNTSADLGGDGLLNFAHGLSRLALVYAGPQETVRGARNRLLASIRRGEIPNVGLPKHLEVVHPVTKRPLPLEASLNQLPLVSGTVAIGSVLSPLVLQQRAPLAPPGTLMSFIVSFSNRCCPGGESTDDDDEDNDLEDGT